MVRFQNRRKLQHNKKVPLYDDSSMSFTDSEIVTKKRKGRKYEDYEDYLRPKKIKIEKNSEEERKNQNRNNQGSGLEKGSFEGDKKENQSEDKRPVLIKFPVRKETCVERIVEANKEKQRELLKKLRIRRPHFEKPYVSDDLDLYDLNADSDSDSADSSPCKYEYIQHRNESKKLPPTTLLLMKNLSLDTELSELRDLFELYLDDIIDIELLEIKDKKEALIEFDTVEAAQHVWIEMIGAEFKGEPIVLEFLIEEEFIN